MTRALTQGKVIEQFRNAHGDRYDYSLVKYINNQRKVTIICAKHGTYEQRPADHKAGIGCIKCGFDAMKEKQRFTEKEAIKSFHEAHGDRYDYSKVVYINAKTHIKIICKKHGVFMQRPEFHKSGVGCPSCGIEKNADARRLSQEEVILEFKKVHGDRYDYSKVIYTKSSAPVEIRCVKHGIFFQSPYEHKMGSNCPSCAFLNKSRGSHYTQERLIQDFQEVHGSLYDYSRVIFERIDRPIIIICKKHGGFEQLPYVHKHGSGCPVCAGQNLDTNKIIAQFQEAHGNRYNYDDVQYKGVEVKVKINCSIHGQFKQLPSSHKSGNGCPSCGEYGFDGNKPAILYYLKINGGRAYKIGITNATVEERFKKYELPRIDVIEIWNFKVGTEAREQEQKILKDYSAHKYKGEPLLSSGNSELFNDDILNLDIAKYD